MRVAFRGPHNLWMRVCERWASYLWLRKMALIFTFGALCEFTTATRRRRRRGGNALVYFRNCTAERNSSTIIFQGTINASYSLPLSFISQVICNCCKSAAVIQGLLPNRKLRFSHFFYRDVYFCIKVFLFIIQAAHGLTSSKVI